MSGGPTETFETLRGNGFRVEAVMGMPISIDLRQVAGEHAEGVEAVLDECFDLLRRVDETFSLWQPDTPMARLSAGAAQLRDVPVVVVEVLRSCVLAAQETGGSFSARRPDGRIDPTGLVKGWAVAQVGDLLLANGFRHWCICAAGDVLAHGQADPTEPWVIGVAAPDAPGELLDAVQLDTGGAVATSGSAERGAHIWDPLRGMPARGLRSATVVCATGRPSDIVRADVLATAAVARGQGAVAWLETITDIDALVVTADGSQECTSGWPLMSIARGAARTL